MLKSFSSTRLAFFLIAMLATYKWTGRELGSYIVTRLQRLQGLFVAAVLLFVIIFHLANLYATQHHGVEHFILEGNNVYSGLFWIGYMLLGTLFPLAICYAPAFRGSVGWTAAAAVMVIAGGLSQMYMIIIGGQAFPMEMFPGKEVSSSFYDGTDWSGQTQMFDLYSMEVQPQLCSADHFFYLAFITYLL